MDWFLYGTCDSSEVLVNNLRESFINNLCVQYTAVLSHNSHQADRNPMKKDEFILHFFNSLLVFFVVLLLISIETESE